MPVDVPAAMKHMRNRDVLVLNDMEDHILPNREAAQAKAQIVASASDARILAEQMETLDDRVNDIVGGDSVAAFLEDIILDIVEVGDRPRCEPMRHFICLT
jgi:hypothetical protein